MIYKAIGFAASEFQDSNSIDFYGALQKVSSLSFCFALDGKVNRYKLSIKI